MSRVSRRRDKSDTEQTVQNSNSRLTTRLDCRVLLVELSRDTRFPVGTLVGFHLLDTVV